MYNDNFKLKNWTKYIIFIMFFCLIFFSFNEAYALDNMTDYITGENNTDISLTILKTLFGGMPTIFNGDTDAMQNVFKIFNVCVLTVGAILMGYTLTMGLISTTHNGEFMGKYSKVMTPLRTAYGVIFVLPVLNGYALIQILIMWLIVQGISIANYIWYNFVSSETLKESLAVSPVQPNAQVLARNVLIATLCMKAIQKQAEIDHKDINMAWTYGYGSSKKILGHNDLLKLVTEYPDKDITLHAGEVNGAEGMSDNSCGTIIIKSIEEESGGISNALRENANNYVADGVNITTATITASNTSGLKKVAVYGGAFYSVARMLYDAYQDNKEWKRIVTDMSKEHANATENLLSNANDIAIAIIDNVEKRRAEKNNEIWGGNPTVETEDGQVIQVKVPDGIKIEAKTPLMTKEQIIEGIDKLASNYQQYFRSAALLSGKNKQFYDNLIKDTNRFGWMMAGTFFTQMGGAADAINRIALSTPESSFSINNPNQLTDKFYHTRYMSALNEYMADSKVYGKNDANRINSVAQTSTNDKAAIQKFVDSGLNIAVLFDSLTSWGVNFFISDQEHPIMQLKRLGGLMLSLAVLVISILVGTMGQVDNGSTLFVSLFGYTIIFALITGGVTLSFILPMMPVFVWLGMCFGWLVLVFQAMIASPLWVIMHLMPNTGEDFAGSQRQGYQLIFTLVLRPVLMIIGFIVSVLVITVIGFFINNVFIYIYQLTQVGRNGLVNSLFGIFVVPLMYASIVYIAMKQQFNIMYKIPDELLSWLGGGGISLGSYAQELSHGSMQNFGVINQQLATPLHHLRGGLADYKNKFRSDNKMGGSGGSSGSDSSGRMGGNSNPFYSTQNKPTNSKNTTSGTDIIVGNDFNNWGGIDGGFYDDNSGYPTDDGNPKTPPNSGGGGLTFESNLSDIDIGGNSYTGDEFVMDKLGMTDSNFISSSPPNNPNMNKDVLARFYDKHTKNGVPAEIIDSAVKTHAQNLSDSGRTNVQISDFAMGVLGELERKVYPASDMSEGAVTWAKFASEVSHVPLDSNKQRMQQVALHNFGEFDNGNGEVIGNANEYFVSHLNKAIDTAGVENGEQLLQAYKDNSLPEETRKQLQIQVRNVRLI